MALEAREKCGVAAIVTNDPEISASELVYENLFAMQHRGAEASGIASLTSDGHLQSHRERGLVRDVYAAKDIRRLAGKIAIGHNRYSTSGSKLRHPQPYKDPSVGFALGHNGNLPITTFLERYLSSNNIKTTKINDSEMMGLAIAQQIRGGQDLPSAVELAYPLFKGAFSCVAMHDDLVVAFRDSKGIRPLAMGSFEDGKVIASETCALDIIDATYDREVGPGEMVIIARDGSVESRQISDGKSKLDMFEFVYFARHDSRLYDKSVNEVRRNFGYQLADQHPPITDKLDNVVVVPIPDTSTPAAEGYAERLGVMHRHAVIKNRYIGRTFMYPDQVQRKQQLRRKHNMIPEAVKGKDVILIDDSVVRLNTLPNLVKLAKLCGARTVSALIASPPVRFPDYYGIDTPKQSELAAANLTIEEMRDKIECNYLGFLSLSRTVEATGLPPDMFNLSCFNGEYPIGIGYRKSEVHMPVSMEEIE